MAHTPSASSFPPIHRPSPATYATANDTCNYYYDIFINHCGKDVKMRFASHLYRSLNSRGFRVFLDKPEMQGGEKLNSQIRSAIKTASVHVAIFSRNYAGSNWCLDELVWMLESGGTIIPVFYDVKSAELRWTEGDARVYAKALRILEERKIEGKPQFDSGTIKKWSGALYSVADISGFELEACNHDEGELVDKIVERVFKKAKKPRFNVTKYTAGLDEKVKDFIKTVLLQDEKQSKKPHVVGILGSRGVGKTTLAKEFFNKDSSKYGRVCFLSDVGQIARASSLQSLLRKLVKGLTHLDLQIENLHEAMELFKEYRAFVIFDEVDDVDQLDALLPVQNYLPSNSLILITSRHKDVLTRSGVEERSIYNLTGLNTQHSRELFCLHAFRQPHPLLGFEYLVDEFLTACHGLPLSLKVFGALLCGKTDRSYWEDQLDRLKQILPYKIEKRLQISYEALNIEEQQIFLHIACFFIGEKSDVAIRILKGSGWRGLLGLQSLQEKYLVEVDIENRINMHDSLRDLGRTIAHATRLRRPFWPLKENNDEFLQQSSVVTELQGNIADLLQQSSVIIELRRNIADLLHQSSAITEVRGVMIMMMAFLVMMIWTMGRGS